MASIQVSRNIAIATVHKNRTVAIAYVLLYRFLDSDVFLIKEYAANPVIE